MTHYYDHDGRERRDRAITVYQFDGETPVFVNLTCDGQTTQIVFDLGAAPVELELVTSDVTAIDGLITALTQARQALVDHQAEHAWQTNNAGSDPNEPLYVPDTWTAEQGGTEGGDHS